MSEVLIKNMEMPSSCDECKLVQTYIYISDECQYLHKKIAHYGRLKGCPLVEVPPHGRLGDLDRMYTETLESFSVWPEHCADDFASFIKDAPTVIEASKE